MLLLRFCILLSHCLPRGTVLHTTLSCFLVYLATRLKGGGVVNRRGSSVPVIECSLGEVTLRSHEIDLCLPLQGVESVESGPSQSVVGPRMTGLCQHL